MRNMDIDDDAFKSIEAIIFSMTTRARKSRNTQWIRRKRIADGSGTTVADVNKLLKQFEDTKNDENGFVSNMPQMMRNMPRRY